jgi:hypothetical protein
MQATTTFTKWENYVFREAKLLLRLMIPRYNPYLIEHYITRILAWDHKGTAVPLFLYSI